MRFKSVKILVIIVQSHFKDLKVLGPKRPWQGRVVAVWDASHEVLKGIACPAQHLEEGRPGACQIAKVIDDFLLFVEGSVEEVKHGFVVGQGLADRGKENGVVKRYFLHFGLVPPEMIENHVILVGLGRRDKG